MRSTNTSTQTRRAGNRSMLSSRARRDEHNRPGPGGRPRRVRRAARGRRVRRDALGRFLPKGAFVEIVKPDTAVGAFIVREASNRSRAEPARPVVKRRWWRAEGPQDPSLPRGYAYEDQVQ